MALNNSQSTTPFMGDTSTPFQSVPFNSQTMPVMQPIVNTSAIPPAPVTVNVQSPTPTPTPTTPTPTTPTTPTVAPLTQEQKIADAYYKDALGNAVSGKDPFNSTILSSDTSPKTVLSAQDKFYQDYLKNQQTYQTRLLEQITPSQAEKDLTAKLNAQKIQAMQNQETALNSGETSSFAGGEAQRVARNDAFKQMTLESQVQTLQNERAVALKGLEALINSNDNSFEAQYKIQQLQNTVNDIDKQSKETFFNLQQTNPNIPYDYNQAISATENLAQFRNLVANIPAELSPTKVQTEVSGIISAFRNEPIVKQYNTVAPLMSSLKDVGVSPTDDINRIYNFAKIMDPDSAVREGEYDTIQAYATAYVEGLGLKANRIFNNDGFLTQEARGFMLKTLNNRYKSIEKSYNNLADDYNKRLEAAKTGKVSGELPNYSAGYKSSAEVGSTPSDNPYAESWD